MKDAIKIILGFAIFFTVVILIGSAIGCGEPEEERQLMTVKELRELFIKDIDTLAVGPMALRTVPDLAFQVETVNGLRQYGARFISQNADAGRESMVRLDTLLVFLDSIYGSGGTQDLSYSNDTLYISGGNAIVITGFADTTEVNEVVDYINNILAPAVQVNIDDIEDLQDSTTSNRIVINRTTDSVGVHRIEISSLNNYRQYAVDTISDIRSTAYPLNSLISIRKSGARYKVQSDSVAGYAVDSIAVIPTGGNYAVLQDENGFVDATWFGVKPDGVTSTPFAIRKAMSYPGKNVFFPAGIYLLDTVIPKPNGSPQFLRIDATHNGKTFAFDKGATLKVADNFAIAGDKVQVLFVAPTTGDTTKNVRVEGLTIDCNSQNNTITINGVEIYEETANPITDITFRDTRIVNGGTFNINANNVKVDGLTMIEPRTGLGTTVLDNTGRRNTIFINNVYIDFRLSAVGTTNFGVDFSEANTKGDSRYTVFASNIYVKNAGQNKTQGYVDLVLDNMVIDSTVGTAGSPAFKISDARNVKISNLFINDLDGDVTGFLLESADKITVDGLHYMNSDIRPAFLINISATANEVNLSNLYFEDCSAGLLYISNENVSVRGMLVRGHEANIPISIRKDNAYFEDLDIETSTTYDVEITDFGTGPKNIVFNNVKLHTAIAMYRSSQISFYDSDLSDLVLTRIGSDAPSVNYYNCTGYNVDKGGITENIVVDGALVQIKNVQLLAGTAAPDAGIGTQGSLYMRNDNDSTLYTKRSGGWELIE